MARPSIPGHDTRLLRPIRLAARIGIARSFRGLLLAGDAGNAASADTSLVLCPNHSNWWDGFVAALVHQSAFPRLAFGLLQQEEYLARYPFFRRAGVIGLDLASPRSPVGGIRRALAFLAAPPAGLWTFPQGVLLDAATPVACRPGAGFLAKRAGVPVVPVGIRYAWMRESKPTILVRLGAALDTPTPEELGEAITGLLEQIDTDTRAEDLAAYRRIVGGGLSLQHLWDRISGHGNRGA